MRPAFVLPAFIAAAAVFISALPIRAEGINDCRNALSAARAGKLDDALKLYDTCFKTAEMEDRDKSRWHYNRANVFLAKGRYNDAIRNYSEAIRIRPDYSLALGSRGLAYEASGRRSEAMADFKKALELGHTSDWLKAKVKGS